MKMELFVLPEVMRRDFIEAFVLDKEEFAIAYPDWVHHTEKLISFDRWYEIALLWDKMSHEWETDFDRALTLLRQRQGKVLFLSESDASGKAGGLLYKGRRIYDYVAVVDPRELADRIEYEWNESSRIFTESSVELTLPEELYVFDTTLDWVIVFTHEFEWTDNDDRARYCLAFGCE